MRETLRQITRETVGQKDLRLGQIVHKLVFYNIHFLGFFHWTVSVYVPCLLRDSETDLYRHQRGYRKKMIEKRL